MKKIRCSKCNAKIEMDETYCLYCNERNDLSREKNLGEKKYDYAFDLDKYQTPDSTKEIEADAIPEKRSLSEDYDLEGVVDTEGNDLKGRDEVDLKIIGLFKTSIEDNQAEIKPISPKLVVMSIVLSFLLSTFFNISIYISYIIIPLTVTGYYGVSFLLKMARDSFNLQKSKSEKLFVDGDYKGAVKALNSNILLKYMSANAIKIRAMIYYYKLNDILGAKSEIELYENISSSKDHDILVLKSSIKNK